MNGKDFEKLVQQQMDREEARGLATMSRYGTHAVLVEGKWTPIHSLPDFEGVLMGGRQFVFDAKVCSSRASLDLNDEKLKKRQLKHLLTRARFGAIAFLLIHFPERALKTKTVPALTVAFPVSGLMSFWQRVDAGEIKSLGREDALELGFEVAWTNGRGNPKPDLLPVILEMANALGFSMEVTAGTSPADKTL